MISIIVPYYKNEKEIKRSLTSILNQSYTSFEVIVINDASPDWESGFSIINDFNDDRIVLMHHEVNKNGASARNTGIKNANGKYIAFLDADDEWLPTHLEDSLELISKSKTSVVYCQATVCSKKNETVMPKLKIETDESISDYLFCNDGFIQTSTIVLDSSLAKKVLFNEKLRRHQDYDFLLRCEDKNAVFMFIEKPNVIVHWENNNPKAKGGTWDFSLQFAKDYKKFFSKKAFSRFILKNSVLQLLEERKILKGFFLFSKYINLTHLSKLNYYFILSYLLFGEFKHPYKWKK